MISVLIVDDHPIVLEGSKMLFQGLDDIYIETELNSTCVLKKMLNTQFDVFLIDVNMAAQDGLSLATDIKKAQEKALVILYTGDNIESYYPFLLEKKVDGILSKLAPREKVIQSILSLMQGDLVISIDFLDYVSTKMHHNHDKLQLTKKEKELISMLKESYTNKMIAEKLDVTQRTVERYLTQIFMLLDVSSRTQAVEYAEEKNLL